MIGAVESKLHMAAETTKNAAYVSGFGTSIGGVMGWLNEYGIAVGALCAVITMIANIYFKRRELKLKERRYER